MPAQRHIQTQPNLGAAIIAGRDSTTGDEVWLVDPDATAEQIVHECSAILGHMNERCSDLRVAGQRRALWLLLAALVGLALPSPFDHVYHARGALLHAAESLSVIGVGALLLLALREHATMGRLYNRED